MFKITKTYEKSKNNLFTCLHYYDKEKIFSNKLTDNTVISSNEASSLSKQDSNFLGKKMFKVKKQNLFNVDTGIISGKWTDEEHKKFIEALYIYNCKWYYIRKYIPTRAPEQIRSHAQKFYLRLKEFKDDSLGLDFTLDSIKNLDDIISIVKKKELLSNNKGKLLFILSEKLQFGKNIKKKKMMSLLSNDNSKNKNDIIIELDENIEENVVVILKMDIYGIIKINQIYL